MNTAYYQKNKEMILNKATDYYENNKERLESKQEVNLEIYLKKIRMKKESMGKIDIIICPKKKNKNINNIKKNIKKIILKQRKLLHILVK